MYYYLKDKIPVKAKDVMDWAQKFERQSEERIVKQEEVNGKFISTVFLGINHNWGEGDPLLFETMVFPSKDNFADLYCDRYSTWEEAELGHKKAVDLVKDGEIK